MSISFFIVFGNENKKLILIRSPFVLRAISMVVHGSGEPLQILF